MAQNIIINGVTYNGVDSLNIPKSGGGLAVYNDLSSDTVTPETLAEGTTAHDSRGEAITGIMKVGSVPVIEKEVNFYDYDGTLLHSYTVDEMQTLTELPPLPTRDGLICQEWNWTLDELKTIGRPMTVGASYITDDGATRLELDFFEETTIPLTFKQSVANGITIDWGDGSATQTVSGTGAVSASHTFGAGKYTVSLIPVGNCTLTFGDASSKNIIGSAAENNLRSLRALRKVFLGKNITVLSYKALMLCIMLEEISIPNTMQYSEANFLSNCYNLKFITVPRGLKSLGNSFLNTCYKVRAVSISPTIQNIKDYTFYMCYSLKRLDLPDSVTSLGYDCLRNSHGIHTLNCRSEGISTDVQTFRACRSLERVKIAEGTTELKNGLFNECVSIVEIDFPSTITSIASNVFLYCYAMRKFDFSKCTSIPTLSNTDSFSSIKAGAVIVVPDRLLAEWKAATNWSAYESYIKGAGEI